MHRLIVGSSHQYGGGIVYEPDLCDGLAMGDEMKKSWFSFLFLALAALAHAQTPSYYISPTGSDSNVGTSEFPWASPNHSIACGQIIQAANGSYSPSNFASGMWGTVTCPAGNNVAWLRCATFDGCKISGGGGIFVDHSYWGVEGWEVSAPTSVYACFVASPPIADATANIHHIVFANNVANGCGGGGLVSFASGSYSADYLAIVGNIAYNAAQNSTHCFSGISVFEPEATDTLSGTHIYVAGNISYDNEDPSTCNSTPSTGGDGIILDSFDNFAYCQQAVVQNNIMVANGGHGFEKQGYVTNPTCAAPTYVKNNTVWGNLRAEDSSTSLCAEWDINKDYGITATSNIVQANASTGCASNWIINMDAYDTSDTASGARPASSISGNFIGPYTGVTDTSVYNDDGDTFAFGSNLTGISPSFARPTEYTTAPSCSGSANVPACMRALIADFTPRRSAVGYGYQKPGNTGITDNLFPSWLCNTKLPSGLVTSNCKAGAHR
jgi:hypothetical protein